MNFKKILQDLSDDFISTWNSSDKEKLMTFFNASTLFISPNVSDLYPEKIDSTLTGADEISEYFYKLYKDKFPVLTRDKLFKKDRTLISYCSVQGTAIKLIVDIKLNEYGKIIYIDTKYVAEYP
jgi:hypothetical protein